MIPGPGRNYNSRLWAERWLVTMRERCLVLPCAGVYSKRWFGSILPFSPGAAVSIRNISL